MLGLSKKTFLGLAVGLGGLALANGARADVTTLTFEGLQHLERIENFYNGGTGHLGSAGANYGISFSGNALAAIDADAGGTANFGGEPSPSTAALFLDNQGALTMNVAAGFDTGFSFYYTSVNVPGSITVYSGLNGTGAVLATLNLPVTPSNGGDPNGAFSPFFPIGVAFAGTAMSVDFGGTANQIAFDNITLGSETPGAEGALPLPSTAAVTVSLLGGLLVSRSRRRPAPAQA